MTDKPPQPSRKPLVSPAMDSPVQTQAAKRAKGSQTIVQARINVDSCLFFSNLLAMRKLRHGDSTYSNLLMENVVAAKEATSRTPTKRRAPTSSSVFVARWSRAASRR